MALFKKTASKDASELKALQAELEKLRSTTKILQAELERSKTELESTKKALAEALKNIEVKIPTPPKVKTIKDGHEYVDLGLPSGVKWATCNVGANKPEEYGDYYAWGETKTKEEYTRDNSITDCKNKRDFSGSARSDAARVNWGGGWRVPTKEEFTELGHLCTWKRVKQNGVGGTLVTGLNGNSIFFPDTGLRQGTKLWNAADWGAKYLTSSPSEESLSECFVASIYGGEVSVYGDFRWNGYTVRPVIK